ncbi:HNH endonuclease [Pelomyxa schiedti]|nr:HNH endonuclease [Pelomyxa schiedti]
MAKDPLRDAFREGVYARDNHRCKICNVPESPSCHLDAHHITDRHQMPNNGYALSNGITLCPDHHKKAEVYHQTKHATWVPGFHPDELYERIGSSFEKAQADSAALCPHATSKATKRRS